MRVCLGPFSEANMAPGKGPLISLRSLVAHYWYGGVLFCASLEFLRIPTRQEPGLRHGPWWCPLGHAVSCRE